MADVTQKPVTGWVGWVFFAAFMMLISGIFQAIIGLVALFNDTVIVSGPQSVFLVDITTWGWAHLVIGLLLAFTGMSLFSGSLWGRSVGVVLAGVSAVANFAFLPVYPLWAITVLVVDSLVIYALIAHGSEARE